MICEKRSRELRKMICLTFDIYVVAVPPTYNSGIFINPKTITIQVTDIHVGLCEGESILGIGWIEK